MAVYKFKTPISEEQVRNLKVNDVIYLTGTVVTARDSAHKRTLDYYNNQKQLPINLDGLAIFHCGPIVKKVNDEWTVVAAGPTTSSRMEPFTADFLKNFKVRVVIGKGGMGKKTVDAMKKYGAVYGAFTGGAAILAAKAIKQVKNVEWLDLGMPEALWTLEVKDFGPLIVAIDSHGNNLFDAVQNNAECKKQRIYEKLGL
ncbi:MAG: fumarate hydratase C-terminal domain-containing protein [Candidatus Bathyarchaeota archaeon]|nr:FumA C-terminus/TtdB family hydratase beta subunit [Candidatus Bathyarchaeum tardum]WGM90419.1 MAG: FumA C-terminus/TtdB family hydratase beta subunit [Candidatus Bathyarchaeum tardum]WNZ29512.1 MAG: fumarate hydratase C-terminal domain-containing protein [Candidatus Bathyarchaeota archaeon]